MKVVATVFVVMAFVFGSMNNAYAVRTAQTTVLSVFASSDGGAFVRLNSTLDKDGNACSSIGRYVIAAGGAGTNALLAAALTAKASGAEVQIDLGACATDDPVLNFIVY